MDARRSMVSGLDRVYTVSRHLASCTLGGTPCEQSHETIRLAHNCTCGAATQQRCNIPRGVGVPVRALGWGGQRTEPSAAGGGIVPRNLSVGLGDALKVTSAPLLSLYRGDTFAAGFYLVRTN